MTRNRGRGPDPGRKVHRERFDPKAAVNAFPSTSAYDNAISSAMENAVDQGLSEEAEDDGHAFWTSVHGQVVDLDLT